MAFEVLIGLTLNVYQFLFVFGRRLVRISSCFFPIKISDLSESVSSYITIRIHFLLVECVALPVSNSKGVALGIIG
jgi:hypothetical protein